MNIRMPNNAERIQKELSMNGPHAKNGHKAAGTLTPAQAGATADRIRARAYELYRERNGGPGDPLSDWLKAEAEVNRDSRSSTPAGPALPPQAVRRPAMDEPRPSLRGETLLRSGE